MKDPGPPAPPLRVLFVEDSPTDVELEERALRQAGLAITSMRAETRPALLEALRDFKPGLVLSDYKMPELDGLAALRIVREVSHDLPFIFVSGTIGEEMAIESLRNGATDYVVKNRLAGLGVKVKRALKEVEERAERRRLEEHLSRAQKMEAIGQLAGGIAHDFNNLLTVIVGYADVALGRVEKGSALADELREIRMAGDRATELTRQLLAFSRKQMIALRVMDLNAAVRSVEKLLRRLIGENIELVALPDPGLGRVKADPGQVEQIIINLVVNSRDAMPDGGRVTIATANATIDEEQARRQVGVKPGPYVAVSVTDTGTGIPPEILPRLFEPFFTTKEKGKGTGLGLATVYGIVTQHGGHIDVSSEPGRGTTFRIHLPRVEEDLEGGVDERRGTDARALPAAGQGVILLVEDEPVVRGLAAFILRQQGYQVLEAGNGVDGLRVSDAHPGPLDLLVTDIIMPQMGGRDLAQRLTERRPGLKVLFISGYTDTGIVQDGVLDPGIHFLQKPFRPDTLARKVEVLLRGGGAGKS